MWERLRALRAGGTSVVISTHSMDEAERLCDRLVVMDHGRIIRAGAPRALIEAELGREAIEIEVGGDRAQAIAEAMGARYTRTPESLVVFGDDALSLPAAAAAAGVDPALISTRRATLEDLFITATGHALRDDGPSEA